MTNRITSLVLSFAVVAPVAAQDTHAHGLGAVTFPVSCNAPAQAQMNTAVAMLHSFWFTEGRKAFEGVAQADSGCGIAYWGVALTYFGNPMAGGSAGQAQKDGAAAAAKAVSMGGRSDRDRAYVDAARVLYQDFATVDNMTRMKAYEAALKGIATRFPQDTEAVIFDAIYQVATATPTDLTFAQQKAAAKTLNALYAKYPNHPGLAHYIIHAFDSPPLAQYAEQAANAYAAIAPDAPHALHMPSHTFTRLGQWDKSIKTNRRSMDLEPTPGAKSHAADYMVYAYLQQGKDSAALAVIKEIGGDVSGEYGTGNLSSYNALAMPARYALERDDWRGAAALKVITAPPSAEAVTHFARGLGAARSGDIPSARTEVTALEKNVADLIAAKDGYWPIVVDAQRMAITAWIAHAEGRRDEAVQIARKAADKEETVEKHPVTPGPLIPSRELLGDLLMVQNKPAEALVAYQATIAREPNRARTLAGAERAAKAAGKSDLELKYHLQRTALRGS